MFSFKLFTATLCFYSALINCQEQGSFSDISIKSIERAIDISSQLSKVLCKLHLENVGKSSVNSFLFSIEPSVPLQTVSYITARSLDNSQVPLSILETKIKGKDSDNFWKISFKENVPPGKTVGVEVEYILVDAVSPYPTSITQKERQLIRYYGNHYVYLPYRSQKQLTVINLGTKHIESYSKLNPYSLGDLSITYGPYHNVEPFSFDQMILHFENNSPFLKVLQLVRVIEVSHWGNIAVEETIDVLHTGATLKGSFSRYDFQRETQSGLSSVKSFKTVLPASATDAYYRDEIGNISTSHMKVLSDSVELDLRPRFPLFGGWKTHYVLGYNVPSYEYLFNKGDNYKLKIRAVDHVYDDMVVEHLVTKVILPEGADSVHIKTPYPMTRLPDARHSTYLDTKGRPVITVSKSNLVENHIQEMEIDYVFPKILMFQEPLLVTLAFYILFILVIFYVRIDLSISKDEASENRLRVSGIVEKILNHLNRRIHTYNLWEEQLSKLKSTKDTSAFSSNTKSINQDYKNETSHISDLISKVKSDSPDIAEKLTEVQKLDKELREYYSKKQILYVEKLVPGKINRNAFMEAETAINKKKDETSEKINAIIKNL